MGNVLVLEDEALIATSVDQALSILAALPLDFAIVDFNLGVETAEPLLAELEAREIPFVVMTGYPDSRFLGNGSRAWPILSKPATETALRDAVSVMRNSKAG